MQRFEFAEENRHSARAVTTYKFFVNVFHRRIFRIFLARVRARIVNWAFPTVDIVSPSIVLRCYTDFFSSPIVEAQASPYVYLAIWIEMAN